MKNLNLLTLLAFFVLMFSACTEDEDPILDETAPVVTFSDAVPTFTMGESTILPFSVTDDTDIASVDISVSYVTDASLAPLDPFEYTNIVTLTEVFTSYQSSESLNIPLDNAAGLYRATVFATDAAGNVSDTITYDFVAVNPNDSDAPSIILSEPPFENVTVGAGDAVSVFGSATDDSGVHKIIINWIDADGNISGSSTIVDGGTPYVEFQENIEAPTELGVYTIQVGAIDMVGNTAVDNSKTITVQ